MGVPARHGSRERERECCVSRHAVAHLGREERVPEVPDEKEVRTAIATCTLSTLPSSSNTTNVVESITLRRSSGGTALNFNKINKIKSHDCSMSACGQKQKR